MTLPMENNTELFLDTLNIRADKQTTNNENQTGKRKYKRTISKVSNPLKAEKDANIHGESNGYP
jgi:lipopolysaccharide export system protein LptA